eukprot:GEMP01054182.1.p1 GENE.GEMP01054182.1~~GEMP01054182.1.p1  ORF type:complete len:410 (+),score=121.98 GEMP01054182.1:81-1310(+)
MFRCVFRRCVVSWQKSLAQLDALSSRDHPDPAAALALYRGFQPHVPVNARTMAMNTMVKVYARAGDKAALYEFLLAANDSTDHPAGVSGGGASGSIPWNAKTYGKMLACCATARDPADVARIVEALEGDKMDDVRWSQVVDAYAQVGDVDSALQAFGKIINVDRRAVGSMLNAYAQAGDWRRAVEFLEENKNKVGVNVIVMNQVINAMAQAGRSHDAMDFVMSMKAQGVEPNCVTLSTLLKAVKNDKSVNLYRETLDVLHQFPMEPDLRLMTYVLHACAKGGKPGHELALDIFTEMCRRFEREMAVDQYNAFLLNSPDGNIHFITAILDHMDKNRVSPSHVTLLRIVRKMQFTMPESLQYFVDRLQVAPCAYSARILAERGVNVKDDVCQPRKPKREQSTMRRTEKMEL